MKENCNFLKTFCQKRKENCNFDIGVRSWEGGSSASRIFLEQVGSKKISMLLDLYISFNASYVNHHLIFLCS